MSPEHLFLIMLAYTMTREVYFMHTVNKLVNKLMSRNLHEYNVSEGIYKPAIPKQESVVYDERDKEDLGALS